MLAYVDAFSLLGWTFIAMIPLVFFMTPAPRAGRIRCRSARTNSSRTNSS